MIRSAVATAQRRSPAVTTSRVASVVAFLSLLLYLGTMNRTFGFVDEGEMAAAAATLGIPHPTGYPLLVVLGYVWTAIVPLRDVLALNILAALLTAASAAVLTFLFVDLSSRIAPPRDEIDDHDESPARLLTAGLAALFTALTATWWNQSNAFEAYSLYVLTLPLVVLLFLRYVDREVGSGERGERVGWSRTGTLFAFILGISFNAHLMTVLLAPGFFYYYFRRLGLNRRAFLRWIYLAPAFVAGLLPYLLLPILSSTEPRISMGKIDSAGRLIDYISGAQFQGWMFSGMKVFRDQTAFFLGGLPRELAYLGIPVILVGLYRLFRSDERLGTASLLMFLAAIVYAGQFAIKEIAPFYLNAIFVLGIWLLAGLLHLRDAIGRKGTLALGAALVSLAAFFNYAAADERENVLVEGLAGDMLGTLPRNALIFSTRWDFWVAGSYYLQAVENVRPDVLVINPNLLRSRAFIESLAEREPSLVAAAGARLEAFYRVAEEFEGTSDRAERERLAIPYRAAYANMVNDMIRGVWRRRPVLVTGEVDPAIGKGLTRVPYHLAYLLRADSSYVPQPFVRYRNFRFWEGRADVDAVNVYEHYTLSLIRRGDYEALHGHDSLASRCVDYALEFDPKLREEDVPELPMGNRNQVIRVIRSYGDLRSMRRN